MRYYLIFLLNSKVIEISSFDEEESRDAAFILYTDNMLLYNAYNELQILNEVC